MAAAVSVHGTERSMCPSRMTSIIPAATIPRKEPTCNCCSRYWGCSRVALPWVASVYAVPAARITRTKPAAIATGLSSAVNRKERGRAGPAETVIGTPSSEHFEPVGEPQQSQSAQADGGEQHQALEQRLQQRIDIEDAEREGDRPQDEGAEDRADRAAGAAQQGRAADHDGRDGVQRIGSGLRDVRVSRRRLQGEEQA